MWQSKIDVDELILPWEHQLEGSRDDGAQPYYHQLAKDLYIIIIMSRLI